MREGVEIVLYLNVIVTDKGGREGASERGKGTCQKVGYNIISISYIYQFFNWIKLYKKLWNR